MNRVSNVTLLDVARAAGVSRSTASNVFAHPARVREDVRRRVEAAALRLGYSGPDPKGRLLRQGKVNAIGIVPPGSWGVQDSLRNPVYHQFLLGVAEVCDLIGTSLVLIPDRAGSGGITAALVDGLVFGRIRHMAETEPALRRRLPFVVVDVDAGPAINSVRVDAKAGGYLAARHLIDLGHRRFAIMSFRREHGDAVFHPPGVARLPEDLGMETDQEKYLGYGEALAEIGVAIADQPLVHADPWDKKAAGLLLDSAPVATAILSMSVMQAITICDEARRRGLKVPQDLSVVGFNDIPDAQLSIPPVTTVDGMNSEKGRLAAGIVLGIRPAGNYVIAPRLVLRSSTAVPRI